ncbi:MAG: 23S rRNA (uracil(1939)-C(5))-methyltransferase RlmD, partial [Hominimerdicola sp.]
MSKHIKINNATGEKFCNCFKRCGGCQLDKTYAEQLEWKQAKAERMLTKFCKDISPIIGMDKPYNYRNKVQTVYKINRSKQIISGVYQSSTRSLTAIDDCMLEDERATAIVKSLKKLMVSFKILPYNPETGRGLLRHTLIRTSRKTGQVMLVLVTASPIFPSKRNFVNAMLKLHPEITTIIQNICTDSIPLTLGRRNIVMYGSGKIQDILCECRFNISPESFYQVNPEQTEKLYNKVVEFAGIKEGDRVIDAYCGTGTIGIICAKNGADVAGVELNSSACRDAINNAKLNKLDNIRFYNEDAEDFMRNLAVSGEKADIVILDPPRAGATESFISATAALAPKKVVYVSCKIETLERDLKIFKKAGYKAKKIQPVDMFP